MEKSAPTVLPRIPRRAFPLDIYLNAIPGKPGRLYLSTKAAAVEVPNLGTIVLIAAMLTFRQNQILYTTLTVNSKSGGSREIDTSTCRRIKGMSGKRKCIGSRDQAAII